MRRIPLLLFFSCLMLRSFSQTLSDAAGSTTWVTNDVVRSVVKHGTTTYIAGDFQYVGPRLPYGMALNLNTGAPNTAFAAPNGPVYAVVSDGSGWFIGGAFTKVGNDNINYLARIKPDGTLDATWNPNPDAPVYALALNGADLYVGGDFTAFGIGGSPTTRKKLAAVNATSGALNTGLNLGEIDGIVRTIAVSGSTVYIGGDFTMIGGSTNPRNRVASFNCGATTPTTGGTLNSWNPDANGIVRAIAVSGSNVFLGGDFTTFNSSATLPADRIPRNRLAAINGSTGVPTTWQPNPNGITVHALTVSESRLYVGGDFTTIDGSAYRRLAAFDIGVSPITQLNWGDVSFGDRVNAIAVVGSTVYVAGEFRKVGGDLQKINIAALDVSNAQATTLWDSGASGAIYGLASNGSLIYAGGDCLSIGGKIRNHIASLDATGAVTSWDPNVQNGVIQCMVLDGNRLYVGGAFQIIAGEGRNRLAAFELPAGTLSSWNPISTIDGALSVKAIAAGTINLYVGGDFTSINGESRKRLAAINKSTGVIASTPGIGNGKVNAILSNGSRIFVGGDFTEVITDELTDPANPVKVQRLRLAAFDESVDGLSLTVSTSWVNNVQADQTGYIDWAFINAMALSSNGNMLFVGGDFSNVQGIGKQSLAAIDAASGGQPVSGWDAGVDGPAFTRIVEALTISGNTLFVGGNFTTLKSLSVSNLGALDVITGALNAWRPGLAVSQNTNASNRVLSISVLDAEVFVGGTYTNAGISSPKTHFSSYAITSMDWIGDSGNWDQSSNWTPAVVPTSSHSVTVSTGRPVMDVDYTVGAGKSLTISGSGGLEIAAGKRLTIAGTADFNGRPVTLKSTATGTASIGQVDGSLQEATHVTVERYIPAGRKWRLLTAPLIGSSPNNNVFLNWQNNGVASGATGVEIWGPNGSVPGTTGLTSGPAGSTFSMRKLFGTSDWVNIENTRSEPLFGASINNAFALYVTGPYGSSTIANGTTPAATTLSATGTLLSGDVQMTLPASAGRFFLVGNPYASSVDPASFTGSNRTNLDNVLYMWDANSGVDNVLGRYVAFNIDGNVYNTESPGYISGTLIQSGQGFIVRATSNASQATLTFKESSKRAGGSTGMLGNSTEAARKSVRTYLQRGGEWIDGAIAFFHEGASASVDAMDGVKMMNTTDNLGLRRSGRTLVFEHRPPVVASDTLFLTVTQMQRSPYRLRIHCEGISEDDGLRLELVDRFSQRRSPISLKDTLDFDFSVDAEAASSGERFMIVISKAVSNMGTAIEPEPGLKMNPYPNPVTGTASVRVDIDRERAPWDLNLTDASGKSLWRKSGVDGGKGHVDVQMSRFGAGVYHLIMTDGRGVRKVSRIVKQ